MLWQQTKKQTLLSWTQNGLVSNLYRSTNHSESLPKRAGHCLHWKGFPQCTPKWFADIGWCESPGKQMWCVWVTLITSRFIETQISLVCLISGHCLKVKVGHSHYLREHHTIIHTIQKGRHNSLKSLKCCPLFLGWNTCLLHHRECISICVDYR